MESQLEVVGLELIAESITAGTHSKSQILGAATLKLREPNEVRTNGAHICFTCSSVLPYKAIENTIQHHLNKNTRSNQSSSLI